MADKKYRNRIAQSLLSDNSDEGGVSAVLRNGINPEEIGCLIKNGAFTAGLNGKSALFEALGKLSSSVLGTTLSLKKYRGFPVDGLLDDRNNRLYISDGGGRGVSAYDNTNGRLIWTTAGDILPQPGGMLLLEGRLIVCERWKSCIIVLDAENGELKDTFKSPLDNLTFIEPYDIALVQDNKAREIWVSDRGAHCIYRLNINFNLMGKLFSRGMLIEEMIWNNSRGSEVPEALFLEYPESLSVAKDIDGRRSVFLWDSGNMRFVVIGTDGAVKREIHPETGETSDDRHFRPRLPLKTKVIDTTGGPLLAATDDTDNSLIFWDPLGAQILKLKLRETIFGPGRQYESLRLVKSSPPDRQFIVASSGELRKLSKTGTDLQFLIETRLRIEPDQVRWQLVHWLANRNENTADCLPPAVFSAADYTERLLHDGNILDRSFGCNLSLVSTLCSDLKRCGRQSDAATLEKACVERILHLNEKTLCQLIKITEIEDKNLTGFGRALALMDLALFHNNGSNQGQALKLDPVLEAIRELPHALRLDGWKLNIVSASLKNISGAITAELCKSSGLENKIQMAIKTLRERTRKNLRELAGFLAADYGDELKEIDWLQSVHSLWLDGETAWQAGLLVNRVAEKLGIEPDNNSEADAGTQVPQEPVVSILEKNLDNIRVLREENKNTAKVSPGKKAVYERRLELAALRASILTHALENKDLADKYRESTVSLTGKKAWNKYDKLVRAAF